MIAVVIPTIPGREQLLDQTLAGYRDNTETPLATIVVRNRPTIGEAWNDGVQAALAVKPDFLHLSADDVVPHPGWDLACMRAASDGVYPSPRIVNSDGSLHSCGTMGGGMLLPECATGTPCGTSPFPFMATADWMDVGPCIPAHYYADDYLAWSARRARLEPRVVREFTLTHLEGVAGRHAMVQRAMADRERFLAAVAVESPARVEVAA